MSTRSNIGILTEQGNVKEMFCGFDGYLQHNGALLLREYNSLKKAAELIRADAIKQLQERVEDCQFNAKKPTETTLEEYTNRTMDDDWSEYYYLFDPSKGWKFRSYNQHRWFNLKKAVVSREIADIIEECSEPDWDGHGAYAIDLQSVKHARSFLVKLPETISLPDLGAEPNGDLGMTWRKNGYHVGIGIDKLGVIAWGGTTPTGRAHGEVRFDGEIPKPVLELLYKIEGIPYANH